MPRPPRPRTRRDRSRGAARRPGRASRGTERSPSSRRRPSPPAARGRCPHAADLLDPHPRPDRPYRESSARGRRTGRRPRRSIGEASGVRWQGRMRGPPGTGGPPAAPGGRGRPAAGPEGARGLRIGRRRGGGTGRQGRGRGARSARPGRAPAERSRRRETGAPLRGRLWPPRAGRPGRCRSAGSRNLSLRARRARRAERRGRPREDGECSQRCPGPDSHRPPV